MTIYQIWDIEKQCYWTTSKGKNFWMSRAAAKNAFFCQFRHRINTNFNFSVHKITYMNSKIEEAG